jgi:PKD repeat protein
MVIPAPVERVGARVAVRRLLIMAVIAAALLCLGAAPALAAPANDDFAAATPAIAPFSDTVDMTDATTEVGEPQFCGYAEKSVWYAVTPMADAILSADTTGSGTPSQLNVYRQDGTGLGGLSFLSCASYYEPAVFHVQAGTTYYLQGSPMLWGGQLSVHIKEVTAPANDNFADATAFSSLPYSDHAVLTAASTEPGEPTACVGSSQKTVWYAFTPSETNSYVVDRSYGFQPLAVYTGRSLGSLEEVACAGYSTPVFRGEAGTTYYLQLADGGPFSGASVDLSVRVAPPATASFFYYPSDPSVFDTVQFSDASFDIAQIASRLWGFGDGVTATDCCPLHRYAVDGDYDAKLEITTSDGRSASATRAISVKTHDVSIARMSVPNSARVGQSRQLSVEVANSRYAETVEVALLRSVPGGGFERVGQVTQSVPVRTHGRMTTFAISYTFAPEDATLGKVTFQAVATIVGARDDHPADKAFIAAPTKVTR